MMLSTRTLAAASARHPWRTIGAWVAVIVLAIARDRDAPRRQPDDRGRADEQPGVGARRRSSVRGVPAGSRRRPSRDIVVVRSDELHGGLAAVRGVRARASSTTSEITALGRASTYLDDASAGLVSEDRHATIVPIALFDDDETEALVEKVEALDEERRVRRVGHRRRRRSTTTSTSSRRRTSRTAS